MTKYSVEEVRMVIDALGEHPDSSDEERDIAGAMLTAFAERIKADEGAVTKEVVERAVDARREIISRKGRISDNAAMRAALLAVWPSPPAQTDSEGKEQWDELAAILGCDGDNVDLVFRTAKRIMSERLPTAESAQAAQVDGFDMLAHLQRQREWSGNTFGPGARSQGVVDHIRKELCEIEEDPGDLKEWIDVVILALDGAWRSGAQPQEIIDALVAKQTKNEGRVWPDWRTADPNKAIEHDRSHDAPTTEPVAQGEAVCAAVVAIVREGDDGKYLDWTIEGSLDALEVGDGLYCIGDIPLPEDGAVDLYTTPPAQPAECVPEGMVLVPREPTDEMCAAAMADAKARKVILPDGSELVREPYYFAYKAMLTAALQEKGK